MVVLSRYQHGRMITCSTRTRLNATSIHHTPLIGLSLECIILFAALSGNDYHSGVKGCGEKTSLRIAQTRPLGRDLMSVYQQHSANPLAFAIKMQGWKQKAQEATLKQRSQNIEWPSDFPSHRLLSLLISPLTSWSNQSYNVPLRPVLQTPRLGKLAAKYRSLLGGSDKDIVKKFLSVTFLNHMLSMFYLMCAVYSPANYLLTSKCSLMFRIMRLC